MRETIGYDLVVEEEELQEELEQIYVRAVNYEEALEQYCRLLKEIKEDSVIEGNTAENLKIFYEEVVQLKGDITKIAEQIYKTASYYQIEIDSADSYLY